MQVAHVNQTQGIKIFSMSYEEHDDYVSHRVNTESNMYQASDYLSNDWSVNGEERGRRVFLLNREFLALTKQNRAPEYCSKVVGTYFAASMAVSENISFVFKYAASGILLQHNIH